MTGREVKNGWSAQVARTFAKPHQQSIASAAAHGKHNMRNIVGAIYPTWNTVRGGIAKGLAADQDVRILVATEGKPRQRAALGRD
jgi:hypothetical protein